MADIVVVMRDGFIEQIGQPLDLYDDQKTVLWLDLSVPRQ